jgi:membrane protein YqaA with SNARE-associated domain
MPFKIFVLGAGVFRLKGLEFLMAVVIGRTIRYSMWGILAVLYGNSVKLYMQKNLNVIGMILLGVFALLILVSVWCYYQRIRTGKAG